MECIVPCREQITDRFPVASFAVHVPEARTFEVACATDPRLLHSRWMSQRTPHNFFSSGREGLLKAPRGQTVWFLPSDQLRRFAGARRIYYALATYGSARGADPHFSVHPGALETVPSIEVSPDFTGRLLNRLGTLEPSPGAEAYGGSAPPPALRWGGDDALERAYAAAREAAVRDAPAAPAATATEATEEPDAEPDPSWSVAPSKAAAFENEDDEPTEASASPLGADEPPESYDAVLEELTAPEVPDASEENAGAAAPAGVAAADEDEDSENTAAVYGGVEPPVFAGAAAPANAAEPASGRDPGYTDGWDEEAPVAAAPLAVRELDVESKIRILRVVARAESGERGYQAVNADSEYRTPSHPAYQKYHIGLSWGFIQFTQRGGALGRVLATVKRRETEAGDQMPAEHRMRALFGPEWEALVTVTNARTPDARLAPVEGSPLWEGPWPDRFRAAGAVPHVTFAQNEVAVLDYFDPMVPIAAALRLDTARGLAVLVDRAIHMGLGGGLRWILAQISPLRNEDAISSALSAVGYPDVATFQRSRGLHANGRWDSRTHAHLLGALVRLDAAPFDVPDRERMLRLIGSAAASTGFASRVRALLDNQTDFDDTLVFRLA